MYKKNIFTKIVNKEIECKKVLETDFTLSFYDINPQNNTHILVIPKNNFINYKDFKIHASLEEKNDYDNHIQKILCNLQNYQIITNAGSFQEILHFHTHILSNEKYLPNL